MKEPSRKLLRILVFFGLAFLVLGCGKEKKGAHGLKNWMTPNDKLKILSTTAMINDVVKRVAGEHADTLTLIQGNLDPHSYQLVKGDDEKIAFADLVFYNGLGLEHGASLQNLLTKSPKAIPLGNKLQQHFPTKILYVSGQVDPHIWMDMSLFSEIVPVVVEMLSEKDPSHRADYERQGVALKKELLALHQEVRKKIQAIPSKQRYLVTSHDAFNYFARAYMADDKELSDERLWQDRFQAPEGLAPDSQLSSANIQLIINHLLRYQIHVIFPESNVSQDSIRKIVQAGQAKGLHLAIAEEPLYGDAMGVNQDNGDTYPGMIAHNADVIEKYLKERSP